ncbi:ribonuclease H-like domain-containing protein [Candidatus Uhrbacteria bacterium]|nr:ribonuclease H-like domain-containing protein [Candidatus Uhrbacteria bacterium]
MSPTGREVVLDIETQNWFTDIGSNDHSQLKISVIGCYFYDTDEYRAFEEREFAELWPRLERADRLIGYNTIGFDYLVMNNYYTGDFRKFPTLDMLAEIEHALGYRLKLQDVAMATIGEGKSGYGGQAVEWWKDGKVDEIKSYCLQDVRVTKGIYEYGLRHGALAFVDRTGVRKGIPVQFSFERAGTPALNLTMGF